MNRQERRNMERRGISKSEIRAIEHNNIREEAFKAGMQEAVDILFYMTAYTINYKLGFGKKRLHRIMWDIYNNIDSYRTGHLTTDDFYAIKKQMQEMGINIK